MYKRHGLVVYADFSVRQEYEEHFVEQITMYTENIRNKDNIIRCKDDMIHNLEREVERLKKLFEGHH